jgi:hypothetical protein
MCAMAQKHVRAPRKRRTSENSVMAKFSIAPAQMANTAEAGKQESRAAH